MSRGLGDVYKRQVLQQLSDLLGEDLLLKQLEQLLAALAPIAVAKGSRLHLDTSHRTSVNAICNALAHVANNRVGHRKESNP